MTTKITYMPATPVITHLNTEMLDRAVCVMEFTKANGMVRRLIGTRNMRLVPSDRWPQSGGVLEPVNLADDRVVVWDVEAGDWRSFRAHRLNWMAPVRAATLNDLGQITSVHFHS